MNYPKIKELAHLFKNPKDLDDESIRYISELIKLIPYVGSFINSQSFGRLRDNKLKARLDEIESISHNALSKEDGEEIYKIVEENRLVLYTFISNYRDLIFKDQPHIVDRLNSYLAIPEAKSKIFQPHEKFKFIIISGASATGKDVQLDKLVKIHFDQFNRVDILRKYTTRKRRVFESEYYRFKREATFQKLVENDKIIFPYSKRENRYGFDKTQLAKDANTNTLLLTVFTEFSILQNAKQFLLEQGIDAKFILFEAPYQELEERTWHRNFPKDDIRKRLRSIKYDLDFIEKNDKLIDEIYDHRIYTGDKISKDKVHLEIIKILQKEIAAPNNMYDTISTPSS